MLKRFSFAAVICVLVFVGSAHAGKGKAKLSVKSVSSPPATAKAGDTFDFTVKLANKGDLKGKGRLKVSLRETKNGPVAAALFSKRVKVAAKSKKSVSRTATLPAMEAGSYRTVACIKHKGERKCRASKGRVTIEVEPGGPGPPPEFTPAPARSATRCSRRSATAATTPRTTTSSSTTTRPTNVFDAGRRRR